MVPVIVTDVAIGPEVGDTPLMFGVGKTVNETPLLETPLAFTTTLPVLAPDGTVVVIDVALQLVADARAPLKLTVPVPWVAPKLLPLMVTGAPTAPEVGERPLIVGAGRTVNDTPLLLTPLACTTTLPVVAPEGTGATIEFAFQLVGVANVPLKLTVLEPCVDPKLLPLIVTDAPTAPELGDKPLMLGAGRTVKEKPLLTTLFTLTTTLPVVAPVGTGVMIDVALQLLGVAVVPLNLTVFVPCAEPKPLPFIVTLAPIAPELGERAVILGVTVNATPLLLDPLTVTTTFPVVAAVGTGATILLAVQLVTVAVTPLNLIVLVPCVDPKALPEIVTDVPTFPDVGDRLVIFGAA